jgi:hypothetical protein
MLESVVMKFELLFFPVGCFTRGPEAYVCARPLGNYEKPDPRSGHILLTSECTDESECHEQIDLLISELKQKKVEASRKFKRAGTTPSFAHSAP